MGLYLALDGAYQQELTYDIGNGKLNAVPMDDSFLPLKEYSFSMLQSAEFLVKHGKTLNSIPFLNNRSRFCIFRLLVFNERCQSTLYESFGCT